MTQVRGGIGVALVALVLAAAACSSSGSNASSATVVPTAACVASMKTYHDALVSSDNNLTDPQTDSYRSATIKSCTRAEWLTAVKQFTGNQITEIVVGKTNPSDVLKTYCRDQSSASACK